MSCLKKLVSEKKDWLGPLFIPVIWLIYARFAPGGEFFGVYRQIVLNPEFYQTNSAIFNPPWIFPILAPWITMPGRSGFIFYLFIILLSSLFATKILKGNFLFVLLSAQLFWILWWGQVDWIVFLGIGLCWYAYKKESWWLIGVAILLVSIKPHLGLLGVLYLWYISKGRLKSAVLVIVFFAISLFIWGEWPVWIVDHAIHMVADPAHQLWNMSLGVWASPILLLVLLVKKSPDKKFLAFVAATMLISPYMPYYSSIVLLGFNLPVWMFVFAFIGYLPKLISPALAWQGLFLFPVSIIIWIYWPEIIQVWLWMKNVIFQKNIKA